MPEIISYVIVALVVAVIVAFVTWYTANSYRQKVYDSKVGSSEERSREII